MPITYIPAISYTFEPGSNNYFNLDVKVDDFVDKSRFDNNIRLPYFKKGKAFKLNWWSKNSLFNYPHIMLTAYYELKAGNKKQEILPSKERLGIKGDPYYKVMGDSGGFQVISKQAKLDPLMVLEWQDNECDWGFTLDIPPLLKVADAHTSHFSYKFLPVKEFKGALRKSADNAMLMLDKRKSNLKLLYALQGFSEPHFNYTKRYIGKKGYKMEDFDGIGIGIKKSNKKEALVYNLLSVLEAFPETKQLHIFGVSGIDSLALAVYALRNYLKEGLHLTFDSSTPIFIAKFLQSYMILGEKIRLRFGEIEYDDIDYLPCNCPICALSGGNANYMKSSTWDKLGDKNIGYTLISLHNLHHMIQLTEMFNAFSTNEEKLKELMNVLYKDSSGLVKAIDELLEYGLKEPTPLTRRAISNYYTSAEVKKL